MTHITTVEEIKAAALPGMYIMSNYIGEDLMDEDLMDVILWETEEDSENDDGANAIGRWTVYECFIRDGVVNDDTFG